jgi:MerR family transcriptional regulator/heat shock protein HspR
MKKIEISRYEPLFSAGLAAEKVGISVMTLRMYEQRGLIIPYRSDTGRRFFSIHDLECVLCIRNLIQTHGLNIEGIKRLIGLNTCWKLNECSEDDMEQCVAQCKAIAPCWSYPETPCHTSPAECRECKVYRSLLECNNLKKLIEGED